MEYEGLVTRLNKFENLKELQLHLDREALKSFFFAASRLNVKYLQIYYDGKNCNEDVVEATPVTYDIVPSSMKISRLTILFNCSREDPYHYHRLKMWFTTRTDRSLGVCSTRHNYNFAIRNVWYMIYK